MEYCLKAMWPFFKDTLLHDLYIAVFSRSTHLHTSCSWLLVSLFCLSFFRDNFIWIMLELVPKIFAFWDNDFVSEFDLDTFGSQKFKTPEQEFEALKVLFLIKPLISRPLIPNNVIYACNFRITWPTFHVAACCGIGRWLASRSHQVCQLAQSF